MDVKAYSCTVELGHLGRSAIGPELGLLFCLVPLPELGDTCPWWRLPLTLRRVGESSPELFIGCGELGRGVCSAFSFFPRSAAATVMLSQLVVSSAMAHVHHEGEIDGSTYPSIAEFGLLGRSALWPELDVCMGAHGLSLSSVMDVHCLSSTLCLTGAMLGRCPCLA
ncbi:hypothetical protein Dimus_007143 [Dionaea muscipula]